VLTGGEREREREFNRELYVSICPTGKHASE
jgi:hypothetical protein